jgi:uncharacterized membrane protein YkvA (DUF1232 family)
MKDKKDDLILDEKGRPLKMAEKLGKEVSNEDIKDVEDKLPSMKKGPVANIWDKVMDIYHGFMSDETPNTLKALLIGSLIYLVLPTDVVPDFLPGIGLLDDVGVLTFIWQKLAKISKIANVVKVNNGTQSITDKVQERIKMAYEKAFEFARDQLDTVIRKKGRQTIYNSLMSLGIFLVAIVLIASESESSVLLASFLILYLFIRSVVNFFRILPTSIKFIKCYFKTKDIDKAISQYLKDSYKFIEPLEELKNKLKILDDVPDLEIIINMQRKSLKKTIITVVVTVILIMVLFFVLRHTLILKTSYTFLSIITLPFQHLYNLIAG